MAAVAEAVLLDEGMQIGLGLVQHDAGAGGRFALRQALGLEQRHVDAGGGKDIRHDAPDGSATDDGDVNL
jgi:hypothetical protein